jgi:hypothetical protein
MALVDKLKSFMSSPQGRSAMDKGRRELSKPENQQKIRTLLNKVTKSK